jgi:hypothetical protein
MDFKEAMNNTINKRIVMLQEFMHAFTLSVTLT